MDNSFFLALAISGAGVALTYSILLRYLNLGRRASGVISISFGVITYIYLQDNPEVLRETAGQIALAIIGGLIALALYVRNRAKG